MRIAYITAGAGMFCGSCIRDNTLVTAVRDLGHDAVLVPTFLPVRTDEPDVSYPRVFLGGVNVFLQEKYRLFRHTPQWLDRLFDARWLLKTIAHKAGDTAYAQMGQLTVSMLRGPNGHQAKIFDELAVWLRQHLRPDVVILTNALLSGIISSLRRHQDIPTIVTLQGDDIFLDGLNMADKQECVALIRQNCTHAAGLIATCHYYAEHMANYLDIDREKISVIYPGINHKLYCESEKRYQEFSNTIGYFARICPEKGIHHLIDAFILLHREAPGCGVRLRIGGWLGNQNRPFFADQLKKVEQAGLRDKVEYVECPDLASKRSFYQSIDILCVPTVYREPKGLYVLEAWAHGVPAVLPAHGIFPELVDQSGGGVLVEPCNPPVLARQLRELIANPLRIKELGSNGRRAVQERFHAQRMAQDTVRLLETVVHACR